LKKANDLLFSVIVCLGGFVLTVSGLFLPWGIVYIGGRSTAVSLTGWQSLDLLTNNYFWAMIPLLGEIFGFFLMLAGIERIASSILATSASVILFQTILWAGKIRFYGPYQYFAYEVAKVERPGPYASAVGSVFVISSALFLLYDLSRARRQTENL